MLLLLLNPTTFFSLLLLVLSPIHCSIACHDDVYKQCESRVAMGECEGLGEGDAITRVKRVQAALAECRLSCRLRLQSRQHNHWVKIFGGLGDSIVDAFGFEIDLCGNGGFTSKNRMDLIYKHAMDIEQPHWIPPFTEVGFWKTKVPSNVWDNLSQDYRRAKKSMTEEVCKTTIINCHRIQEHGDTSSLHQIPITFYMHLTNVTYQTLNDGLLPLAEAWAGVGLKHSRTYGIRRYTNGSWLGSHLDVMATHIISAIVNVGQEVDEDWPLYIKDNNGNDHQVFLKPGEMVWYESARLVHGRMDQFKGKYFDNIFIHYMPLGEWYSQRFEVGQRPWQGSPITLQWVKRIQEKGSPRTI